MIKMMMAVRRKPGMSLADYRDYIRVQHGKLALDQPNGVLRYVQNHVFDGAYGSAGDAQHGPMFARDSVTELWFAGLPEFGRNVAHPYTRDVIIPDGKNFADVATNIVVVTREEDVAVANPGNVRPGAVKIMHFLQKQGTVSLDEFSERWRVAHRKIIAGNASLAACLRRSMLSHALPPPPDSKPPQASQDFGGTALPSFHGVASLWFDDEAALTALRGYLHDLQVLGGGEGGFFNPSAGFYVCARETLIFDLSCA